MAYPEKIPDVPVLPPGTVLCLNADDWAYGRGARPGQPVELRVEHVRTELALHYGGHHVWVDGHVAGCLDDHPRCCQLLVRVEALRQAHLRHVSRRAGAPDRSAPPTVTATTA